ncbi:MAG: DNA repair protein RecO [Deltaproteobacteria bacterium]|nr:MAG: DNA repair protein RecO [Deltaproteobacteria bacterium]
MKSHSRGREVVTEAIVLKVQTIQENDLWVDLLTPREGRLWGVARHGRKSKKRFSTVLEASNHVRVRFRDKGGVVFLEESQLQLSTNGFPELDLPTWLTSFFIIDLVREFVPERNRDIDVFELVRDTLLEIPFLNRYERLRVLENFEKDFLSLCGYGVNFERCALCQTVVSDEQDLKFYFVYREGSVFCQHCMQGKGEATPFS